MSARQDGVRAARSGTVVSLLLWLSALGTGTACAQEPALDPRLIALPAAQLEGEVSVERALHDRRSWRRHHPGTLTLEEVAQVLWSAQGITNQFEEDLEEYGEEAKGWFRTTPSAGALYPLELYLVAAHVDGLPPGVYHYLPVEHALEHTVPGDLRVPLKKAAHDQAVIGTPPAVLVIAGAAARTAVKYGERAQRYVLIEAGAAAENVHLQCESLELATVIVGAFLDQEVKTVLQLPEGEEAYLLMPIGRRGSR